jgi:hypothetical protein
MLQEKLLSVRHCRQYFRLLSIERRTKRRMRRCLLLLL